MSKGIVAAWCFERLSWQRETHLALGQNTVFMPQGGTEATPAALRDQCWACALLGRELSFTEYQPYA